MSGPVAGRTKKFHEIANLFPLQEGRAFVSLVEGIRQHGLLEPLVTYEDKILDGRSRALACLEAGVEPRYEAWEGDYASAVAYVLSKNLHRHDLTPSQCAAVVAEAAALVERLKQKAARRAAAQSRSATKTPSGQPGKKLAVDERVLEHWMRAGCSTHEIHARLGVKKANSMAVAEAIGRVRGRWEERVAPLLNAGLAIGGIAEQLETTADNPWIVRVIADLGGTTAAAGPDGPSVSVDGAAGRRAPRKVRLADHLARVAGTNPVYVYMGQQLKQQAPTLHAAVRDGRLTIPEAWALHKLPEPQRTARLTHWEEVEQARAAERPVPRPTYTNKDQRKLRVLRLANLLGGAQWPAVRDVQQLLEFGVEDNMSCRKLLRLCHDALDERAAQQSRGRAAPEEVRHVPAVQ